MDLHLKICHDVSGTWSVHGLSPWPVSRLPSLSASIDYARKECAAVPATIELLIDGCYLVVHQERGWPRRLLAPQIDQVRSDTADTAGSDAGGSSTVTRLLAWVKGRDGGEIH
jgi:hypothetical protein